MNTATKKNDLESVCESAETLLKLESELTGNPVDEFLKEKLRLWKTGIFRVVIMGEIKSGKSSFINALLAHPDLVPVHSDVATSTIFKISYGEKVSYKVFFLKSSGKNPLEIDAGQVDAYGTEDGNPANEKQVDFIRVTCPSELLRGGLVIVDTPGLGGLYSKHKFITYHYVPRADAVFVVTDGSSAPIGKAEIDLYADLRKVTEQVYFVQSKSRAIDKDTRELRTENNREIIADFDNCEKSSVKLFVVDSSAKSDADRTKDAKKLERSGFAEVVSFVNQDIRLNAHRIIIDRVALEMRPHWMAVDYALMEQSKLLAADSEEKKKILLGEYNDARAKLKEFKEKGVPQIKKILGEGEEAMNTAVKDVLMPFKRQSAYAQRLMKSVDAQKSVKGVIAKKESIRQELTDKCLEDGYNYSKNIREVAEHVLKEAEDIVIGFSCKKQLSNSESEGIHVNLDPNHKIRKVGFYDKSKAAYYGVLSGGAVFGALGGLVGGAIGTVALPGVGTYTGGQVGASVGLSLAAVLGMGYGAKKGWDDVASQSLDAAQQGTKNDIMLWLSDCSVAINDAILPIVKSWKKEVESTLADAIKRYEASLVRQINAINGCGQLSQGDLAVKTKVLHQQQELLRQCRTVLLISK